MTSSDASIMQPKLLDVLIIGGGLSGLLIAQGVQRMHAKWRLLEARPILGGRLKNDEQFNQIDLGGAWIWPQHQPNVLELTRRSLPSIRTFPQPDDPSSTRIEGGALQLIHSIAGELVGEQIQLSTPVTSCKWEKNYERVRVETANNETFFTRKVVFAVPPKLISRHITFDPPLTQSKQAALASSQTWMAGVTKVALLYPRRFWDLDSSNMGLPMNGPAFQVYDSSTNDGNLSALTFFTLVPPSSPAVHDDEVLAERVADQMATVWNYLKRPDYAKQAHKFSHYFVHRWPLEKYISEDDKPLQINPHPSPVRALSQPEWGGVLQFAGSETDLQSPGVMEGAVSAAKRVLKELQESSQQAE